MKTVIRVERPFWRRAASLVERRPNYGSRGIEFLYCRADGVSVRCDSSLFTLHVLSRRSLQHIKSYRRQESEAALIHSNLPSLITWPSVASPPLSELSSALPPIPMDPSLLSLAMTQMVHPTPMRNPSLRTPSPLRPSHPIPNLPPPFADFQQPCVG